MYLYILLFLLEVNFIENVGKIFEKNWNNSIDKNKIYRVRLKDNPLSFKTYSDIKFVSSNPYDSIYFYDKESKFFGLEFKTTKYPYMTIQRSKSDKNKMIKNHQIKGLTDFIRYENAFGFFILDFRGSGITYGLSIDKFLDFLVNTTKKTISESDVQKLGAIKIQKCLKRKYYVYDVIDFFNKAIKNKEIKATVLGG